MSKLGDLVSAVGGRLTLATGVPVTTTDQTAKTTLYYTPYLHNKLALYDGTNWKFYATAEISITLAALTASRPYDVWAYDNAGTVTLELLAWTNTTTRATALAYQDGVLVKSGATTRRYLGTVCINVAGGQSEDSLANRLVFNYYNRVLRPLYITDATATWTINNQTARQANGSTANQVAIMCGVAEDAISLQYQVRTKNVVGTNFAWVAIGRNSATVQTSVLGFMINSVNNQEMDLVSTLYEIPPLGYSYYAALESAGGAGNVTFTGTLDEMRLHGMWKA